MPAVDENAANAPSAVPRSPVGVTSAMIGGRHVIAIAVHERQSVI